ncbi:MAG: hypothetical protein ACE5KE_00785 [Methanosarcinales archaeon]
MENYFTLLKEGSENKIMDLDKMNKILDLNRNQLRVFLTMAKKGNLLKNIGRGLYVLIPPEIAFRTYVVSKYKNSLIMNNYILNFLKINHAFADLGLNHYTSLIINVPIVITSERVPKPLFDDVEFLRVSENLLEDRVEIFVENYRFKIPSPETEILVLTYMKNPRHTRGIVEILKKDIDLEKILRRAISLGILKDITEILKRENMKYSVKGLKPEKTKIEILESKGR